jgi:hypothetical protein
VGSNGKKGMTMAKLNRESRLRDKRAQKQARRAARKLDAADETEPSAVRADEPAATQDPDRTATAAESADGVATL